MPASPHKVSCPTCKQAVEWTPGSVYKPFCSQRCKLIDLGAWASESHAIAGEAVDLDADLTPKSLDRNN